MEEQLLFTLLCVGDDLQLQLKDKFVCLGRGDQSVYSIRGISISSAEYIRSPDILSLRAYWRIKTPGKKQSFGHVYRRTQTVVNPSSYEKVGPYKAKILLR